MQCYGQKLILPSSVLFYGLHPGERNTKGHVWDLSVQTGNCNLPTDFDLRVAEIFQETVKNQKGNLGQLNVSEDA